MEYFKILEQYSQKYIKYEYASINWVFDINKGNYFSMKIKDKYIKNTRLVS